MLESGFLPSFYHFVDTILELKMEVHIREEQSTSFSLKETTESRSETEVGAEVSTKVSVDTFLVGAEINAKASWRQKTSSAYSRTMDASHSQKFSQDLSASSLMRTKLVPVPPPELLVERIKILLERLRKEAEDEDAAQVLFTLDIGFAAKLDAPDKASITTAFSEKNIALTDITVTQITAGSRWSLTGTRTVDGKSSSASYFIEKSGEELKVYQGSREDRKSIDQILMDKVSQKLLERLE
jgi:hypothetical protein